MKATQTTSGSARDVLRGTAIAGGGFGLEDFGAGLVKAICTAKGEQTGLEIDPSIFQPDEKEVVEDLILAAIKDAQSRAAERAQQEMRRVTEAMGLPADMKLPF